MRHSDFYTCEVLCYVIKQVEDDCSGVQGSHNFAAFKRKSIGLWDACVDVVLT